MGLSLKTRKEIQKSIAGDISWQARRKRGRSSMNLREQPVKTGIILSWVLTNYGKSTWVTIDGNPAQ